MTDKLEKELYDFTIEKLTEFIDYEQEHYACDLHHYIFNEDYYIIGHYNSREWLKKHDLDVFEVIEKIKQYEEDTLGQLLTDLSSPERVVNMYVYILGEEILNESDHLQEIWDNECTIKDYEKIINELSWI